jgi:hypothetical protein
MAPRPLETAGWALLVVALVGCGTRGYEPAAHEPHALNFQPGYPPGYLPAAQPDHLPSSSPSFAGLAHAQPSHARATHPTPNGSPRAASPPPPGAPLPASVAQPPTGERPYRVPLSPTLAPSEPAVRIASLSPAECRAEIAEKRLPVAFHGEETLGIATPVRLTGPLRGVRFITHPAPSPFGLMDCRMALALDELAAVLATFEVVEVRVDNVYRKGARINGRGRPSQHSHALAADITTLKRRDGGTVKVEGNWAAPIGATPCGPDATLSEPSDHAPWLRDLVCTVAQRGIFHHVLTPSSDAAHRDHLHLDLQRDARNRFVR